MPFGIKGKTKEWEEETKIGKKVSGRIDRCVNSLVSDPNFKPKVAGETKKQAAIKVCKKSITRSKEFSAKLI